MESRASEGWTAGPGFDEALGPEGARAHYAEIVARLAAMPPGEIARRERLQNVSLMTQGITFNVYGDDAGDEAGPGGDGRERVFPFDFVPRVVPAAEWRALEAGLVQRTLAINLFLLDVYTEQRCLHDGVIPWELVLTRKEYRRQLRGVVPPRKVYTHVVGTDLVRDDAGTYRVLEDNCRCPSGVSYVVENRNLLQRTFPELFADHAVRPVRAYPQMLLETLAHVAPRWSRAGGEGSLAVVLTPGSYNSAYFEHSFLAREMGVPLVEGTDLLVEENHVYVRTTEGRRRVEAIYRRVDDDYLDPVTFGHASVLGVPGLINAYRDGNVAIANAPGAGVADDKAVYAYVPDLIRYYMGEEPLLAQVPTYTGFRPDDFAYMLDHLDQLVVKTTGDAGGYGMLMGPFATAAERAEYAAAMRADPGNYVAQPLVEISSHPTRIGGRFVPRRVDLRPFILYGDRVRVLPGGLTRVALQEGSYVVNSSQGGGSKDTWVLDD